ncbi:MAG: hypothetical protein F4X40_07930 [Chloroflexi bacterium]|nr:hypothetical protein [Chloroflexota bacterium]
MSAQSTDGETLKATEAWFRRQGVPHLIEDYSTRRDILTRTLPFLVTVLAIQILLIPRVDWPWWASVLSVVGAVAAVAAAWVGINALRRRRLLALPEKVGAVEVLVFLLTAPMLTGFILGDWETAAIEVLLNALLLLGAYLTVSFALIPILRWSARRLIRDALDVLGLFARALPLLLIFVTFMFITAEVWQMAGTIEVARLLAVIGLFALVAAAFLISRLPAELSDLATFSSSERVTELAQGTPAASLGVASDSLRMDAPLRPAQWANVGLVVVVALALRVLFVSGLVGVFFLVFGAIAMDLNTISSWTQSDPRILLDLPWSGTGMTVELLQVAAFMAAFSGFYFTIRVLTDHEYRDEFFEDVVGDVRQSLAVRAVYLGALAQHAVDRD